MRLFSACCNGDTFASEIGSVLSRSEPYLITTFKKVPRGTNGGISIIGSLASILGGTFVGLSFYVGIILGSSKIAFIESPSQYQFDVIFIGSLAGFMGSLIDSLLGKVLVFYCFSITRVKSILLYSILDFLKYCCVFLTRFAREINLAMQFDIKNQFHKIEKLLQNPFSRIHK